MTYRQLSVEAVVRAAVEAGLRAVEWGGDVHVPHGDLACAERVRGLTLDAGLELGCYGSYLRLGGAQCHHSSDGEVLGTAAALGAPAVRIWAGTAGSEATSAGERLDAVQHCKSLADAAADVGLRLVLEYHADTLTDTAASALRLLDEVDRSNVELGWQPPNHLDFAGRRANLAAVVGRIADVHVFHWTQRTDGGIARHPLAGAADDWAAYLSDIARGGGQRTRRRVMLEFVPGDDPGVLVEEAETLRTILDRVVME